MKFKTIIATLALLVCAAAALRASESTPGRFEAGHGTFLLNGSPFVVKAAELHYPRIPRPFWEHRIKMCKALGMNTICLYVFWNAHEPEPDRFDFEGNNDLAEFIRLCAANGMFVILRPGPYVCAEWEMGGLPWWLLRDTDIRLRENDPRFLERVGKFQQAVANEVKGLTIAEGGPIIMVQVENEYGSYGTDKDYVGSIRDMLRAHFGPEVTLFQCDWSSNFLNNGLDDLVWTLNFGTGANIDQQFEPLRRVRPDSPLMCSEFWSGWFDKWGANHETRPASEMTAGIDEMLSKGISFSLYMTHGGTNWGHWAGANSPGYAPDVTSYDYDAPINEHGAATPKYHALRNVMARYSAEPLLPIPDSIPTGELAPFEFSEVGPLFANLPAPVPDTTLRTMEELGQGFGSILYRTTLPDTDSPTLLTVDEAHDFAQVFVDGRFIGTLDRRLGEKSLALPAASGGTKLEILVEAMGRINFGRAIKDFKGITESVNLTENIGGSNKVYALTGWETICLPDQMNYYDSPEFLPVGAFTPGDNGRLPRGVYRASFNVERPADTFLDMSSWGKGLVYVNGHPLGRFWEIGPQQTLYLPGCWLRDGENDIMVFDILGPREARCRGLATPILNDLRLPQVHGHRHHGQSLRLGGEEPALECEFGPGNGWQRFDFGREVSGRFVCLQLLSTLSGTDNCAIAEFYLLGGNGERLPREAWTARYADAEDAAGGNHTADKSFDLQESTYWSTGTDAPLPHALVIDLGSVQTVRGFEYLPRMEAGTPGAAKAFRIYLRETDFAY